MEKKVKYIDLFCGLGAFHTAFNGDPLFECVFACDIDEGIRRIYEDNYGLKVHGDIRSVVPSELPDFQVLCAGFPCQPFSIAGNREGFNDAEKGNLFYDILKIVDAKKPPMCILENVKNLKTHDDGNTYKTIESELTKRGYLVSSKVLDASHFGSPQARQRIFIMATKGRGFAIPDGISKVSPVSSIIDPDAEQGEIDFDKYDVYEKNGTVKDARKPKILYDLVSKNTGKGGRQGERVYDVSHVGVTVCASSGGPGAKTGLYKVGDAIRRLNVKETLGMFGFPPTYKFTNTNPEHALFYLGNSIVVNVVQALVPRVAEWFQAAP
jgi:DNA (cytosine-5)-methyltransferase 1